MSMTLIIAVPRRSLMDRHRGIAVRATSCVAAGLLVLGACGDDQAATDAAVPVDAPSTTSRSIQEVQDGTVATGASVSIDKVFVTAARISNFDNLLAFVQEPDGVTSGGHTYPQYAGVRLFVSGTAFTQFPGIGALQIGDCISITASTVEYMDDTQLDTPTAFALEPGGSCGTAPAPLVVPFGSVDFDTLATDTDGTTMGDQAGAMAETYEGVLVQMTGVSALAATDAITGEFQVVKTGGGSATLSIGTVVYTNGGPVPATAGRAFSSITGVFAQRMSFQLLPRSEADLQ